MATSEQIQNFNEAVRALNDAENEYKLELEKYQRSANHDSLAVDRAMTVREIAKLIVALAELQLGKS